MWKSCSRHEFFSSSSSCSFFLLLLFLTLGGNSFAATCIHTRHIHDFLLFDGLNLERVFDKRVIILCVCCLCAMPFNWSDWWCLRTRNTRRKKDEKRKKCLTSGWLTYTYRLLFPFHTSECLHVGAWTHAVLLRKIVSELFEKNASRVRKEKF